MFIRSILIVAILFGAYGCTKKTQQPDLPELVIYAYKSFTSEWGLGPTVIPIFESQCRCKVKVIGVGDTGAMVNRLILEGKKTNADVILGIDNSLAHKALKKRLLQAYKPKLLRTIDPHLIFDPSYRLIPFDWGFFAVIYDSTKISDPPRKLEDLTKTEYRKKLILQDPRTSTPGLGFLLWTVKALGKDYKKFWSKLKPNILAVAPGWDMAYGMFIKGEAPMVLSYITSPAYHQIHEQTSRYKAARFDAGHYMQVEGVGISAYTDQLELAKSFIDFTLSIPFQRHVPLKNFMLPVNRNTPLPKVFADISLPPALAQIEQKELRRAMGTWLSQWRKAVQ